MISKNLNRFELKNTPLLETKLGQIRVCLEPRATSIDWLSIFCLHVGLGPSLWLDLGRDYTKTSISRIFRPILPQKEPFWLFKAPFLPRVSSKIPYRGLWKFFCRSFGDLALKPIAFVFHDLDSVCPCSKSFEKRQIKPPEKNFMKNLNHAKIVWFLWRKYSYDQFLLSGMTEVK